MGNGQGLVSYSTFNFIFTIFNNLHKLKFGLADALFILHADGI